MARSLLCLLAVACVAAHAAFAQAAWPAQVVTLVVGFPPGGSVDLLARSLTAVLSNTTGQSFVVRNRLGATGFVAAAEVAQAPADGYTALLGHSTTVANAAIHPDAERSATIRRLRPAALTTMAPFVLVTAPTSTVTDARGAAAAIRARPGTVFANPFVGSVPHLGAGLFGLLAKGEIAHVSLTGISNVITALGNGQAGFALLPGTTAVDAVRTGKVRALAVASTTRFWQMPDVPTFEEQGIAGMVVEDWTGVFLPPGVPPEIVAAWHQRLGVALRAPEFERSLQATGARPMGLGAADFQRVVEIELVRWSRVGAGAGIRPPS